MDIQGASVIGALAHCFEDGFSGLLLPSGQTVVIASNQVVTLIQSENILTDIGMVPMDIAVS